MKSGVGFKDLQPFRAEESRSKGYYKGLKPEVVNSCRAQISIMAIEASLKHKGPKP